jgi:hypothetical protein
MGSANTSAHLHPRGRGCAPPSSTRAATRAPHQLWVQTDSSILLLLHAQLPLTLSGVSPRGWGRRGGGGGGRGGGGDAAVHGGACGTGGCRVLAHAGHLVLRVVGPLRAPVGRGNRRAHEGAHRLCVRQSSAVGKLFVVPAWALPVPGSANIGLYRALNRRIFSGCCQPKLRPVPVKAGSTTASHQPSSPNMDTNCITPSLIPTVNGNTVRGFHYARTTVRSPRKLDHGLTLST